jgi:hypothetical protein
MPKRNLQDSRIEILPRCAGTGNFAPRLLPAIPVSGTARKIFDMRAAKFGPSYNRALDPLYEEALLSAIAILEKQVLAALEEQKVQSLEVNDVEKSISSDEGTGQKGKSTSDEERSG